MFKLFFDLRLKVLSMNKAKYNEEEIFIFQSLTEYPRLVVYNYSLSSSFAYVDHQEV
jgi:hypothetical protein